MPNHFLRCNFTICNNTGIIQGLEQGVMKNPWDYIVNNA